MINISIYCFIIWCIWNILIVFIFNKECYFYILHLLFVVIDFSIFVFIEPNRSFDGTIINFGIYRRINLFFIRHSRPGISKFVSFSSCYHLICQPQSCHCIFLQICILICNGSRPSINKSISCKCNCISFIS